MSMDSSETDYRRGQSHSNAVQVILLGDSLVGKTSIIRYVNEGKTTEDCLRTATQVHHIQDCSKVELTTENGQRVKLDLWDTCGHEKYHTISSQMLRNMDIVLLVYDITNKASFEHIQEEWTSLHGKKMLSWIMQLEQQENTMRKRISRTLVGNKSDLGRDREVLVKQGEELASNWNALFYETSAKTGNGINEIFKNIAEKVALQNFKRWSEKSNSISPIEESRAFNISDIPVSHKYKHKCC